MIKILHTADWHIDQLSSWSKKRGKNNSEISEFSEYHLNVLEWLVNKAISENYNFFIFGGDLFADSIWNYREKSFIHKEIIRFITLLRNNNIHTIFISWNHDITKRISLESRSNSLEVYTTIDYDNYLLVQTNQGYRDYEIDNKKIRFVFYPYLRWIYNKEQIVNQLKDLWDKEKYWLDKVILIWHLDIFWALYNGIEIQSLNLEDINTYSPEVLESLKYDLYLLGHVHNHQILGKQKKVIYCWSPYRLSFNEENVEKWYYEHRIDEDKIESEFKIIENKVWKTIRYNVKEKLWSYIDLLSLIREADLEDNIIRIIFEDITDSDKKYIPYKEIEELLNSKKIFLLRPYSYKRIYEETSNLNLISETTNIENIHSEDTKILDPKHILTELLKEDESKKSMEEYLNLLDEILIEIDETKK